MLDKWQEDIVKTLQEINGGKDSKLQPKDCLIVNNALFSLIKSYVWRTEFEGAELHVRCDNSGYSWVQLPQYHDPFSESRYHLDIRDAKNINVLQGCYEHDYYGYDEDVPQRSEPWATDRSAKCEVFVRPIPCDTTKLILSQLKAKSSYYELLLEEDVSKQLANLAKLSDYKISIVTNNPGRTLDNMTQMGQSSPTKSVFGHRYFAYSDKNRIYLVASNALGPVGILSLFDYGALDGTRRNPDKLSVSFVSVSPSFRQLGIGSALMLRAAEYAQATKRYIVRTDPTEVGKKLSYEHFSKIIAEAFPKLPFIDDFDADHLHQIEQLKGFSTLPYQAKCSIITETMRAIADASPKGQERRRYDYGLDASKAIAAASQRTSKLAAAVARIESKRNDKTISIS